MLENPPQEYSESEESRCQCYLEQEEQVQQKES